MGCQGSAFSEGGSNSPVARSDPSPVAVAVAKQEVWPRVVRVQGSLVADERAVVGAKVAGRIKKVPVDMGSTVSQGGLLAELETDEFRLKVQQAQAELEQARAKLGLKPGQSEDTIDRARLPSVAQEEALRNQAQANLKRAESLASENVIAQEELDQRKAELEVAEARYRAALDAAAEQIALIRVRRAALALAEQNLADAQILAPFDGTVEQRHVAPGSYVQVGQPVVSLVRTDPLRFRAGVPERQAAGVRGGLAAKVKVEGWTEPFLCKLSRVSPALDLSNRSLSIEIDVPNPAGRLRAGLFAEAEIEVDPHARTLVIPARAVREFAGVEKVRVLRDGQAVERVVRAGRREKDRVEVLDGLSEGDRVELQAEPHATPGADVHSNPPAQTASDEPMTKDENRMTKE